jgi:hypothetical protein
MGCLIRPMLGRCVCTQVQVSTLWMCCECERLFVRAFVHWEGRLTFLVEHCQYWLSLCSISPLFNIQGGVVTYRISALVVIVLVYFPSFSIFFFGGGVSSQVSSRFFPLFLLSYFLCKQTHFLLKITCNCEHFLFGK